MTRYTNDDDDFELIDGKRCLKDGRTLRVRLPMMDSVQQGVAAHASKHKPGFVTDAANDHRQRMAYLYDSYDREIATRYRVDGSKEKKKYYDPTAGTMVEAEGEESEANVGDSSFFASQPTVERQLVRDSQGGIFRPQRVRAFDGTSLGLHRPGVQVAGGRRRCTRRLGG